MAEIIITSYFTTDGEPTIGLNPTIRIWEIAATGQNLVIGTSQGTADPGPAGGGVAGGVVGTDGQMLEVYDDTTTDGSGPTLGGSRDGFYKYVFSTDNGYDPKKCYAFRVDGGTSQIAQERYQVGELNIMDNAEALVDLVYDEPSIDHISTGSFGEMVNQISASTSTLLMDVADVMSLVELAVKYQANRTKIDHTNATMTIYDVDCTTPLRTFALLDGNGNPSITEMCERVPIAAGTTDNQPTCTPAPAVS